MSFRLFGLGYSLPPSVFLRRPAQSREGPNLVAKIRGEEMPPFHGLSPVCSPFSWPPPPPPLDE